MQRAICVLISKIVIVMLITIITKGICSDFGIDVGGICWFGCENNEEQVLYVGIGFNSKKEILLIYYSIAFGYKYSSYAFIIELTRLVIFTQNCIYFCYSASDYHQVKAILRYDSI